MNIINATLRKTSGLYTVRCEGERISAITLQNGSVAAQPGDIDARGQLLIAPLVEPHIHSEKWIIERLPAVLLDTLYALCNRVAVQIQTLGGLEVLRDQTDRVQRQAITDRVGGFAGVGLDGVGQRVHPGGSGNVRRQRGGDV